MGGRTPAKPLWSEVMIFFGYFLRRGSPLPEEDASSDKKALRRKTDLRPLLNSGERMFAGGESMAGG